ncbi:hypothetical protein CCHL11_05688 [Colletotrichum chlorophyti]|uniref:Uncharacterized protein n=1 Tax=Colletotrichum chlorophyti TaxID=708187 RepID=A0A1Q8RTQ2_9PEZI|nr:hypothetical protein CCHL11_05688 [Colletotrichum chlorophyti]
MLFLSFTAFAGVAVAACTSVTPWPRFGNWTETFNGYKYTLSGPAKLGKKADFEIQSCQYVWNLINARTYADTPAPAEAQECMDKLYERKKAIGDEGFLRLLANDIEEAKQFWYDVNDNSTLQDPKSWVAVEARAVFSLPDVTAWAFSAWSASPFADAANNRGNAEHYFKKSDHTGALGISRILEGWGGVTTNFTIPNYSAATCAQRPQVRPLPEFLIKACGDKNLVDESNTNFGVLNIAARDVDGGQFGQPGMRGVDLYASIWYGNGISEEHLEAERQHVIIEMVNLSLKAQEDIESGAFVVPPLPQATS